MYLGHASGVYNTQGSVMITFIQIFNNLWHGSIVPGILDDFVVIMYFTILHIVSSGR